MGDNVNYNKNGRAGLQCKNCHFFRINLKDESRGKCFSRKTKAIGNCNRFVKKFNF